jgi:hypothetical protein
MGCSMMNRLERLDRVSNGFVTVGGGKMLEGRESMIAVGCLLCWKSWRLLDGGVSD